MISSDTDTDTGTDYSRSGAVVSVCYIPDDEARAYVGFLGDCPVLIRNADGEIVRRTEHSVALNAAEVKRVKEEGAFVSGAYMEDANNPKSPAAMFTRSLGDLVLDSVLGREAEIYSVPLGPESWILLATDGVFDGVDSSFVGDTEKQDDRIQAVIDLILQGGGRRAGYS